MDKEILGFAIEAHNMEKLKSIANKLCGGSDTMRDEGNRLWLIIWDAEKMPLESM